MQRVFAIVKLTWKAAFRYRLFWVLTLLLIGSVIALPLLIKDDGTARGFTQILLTYTLIIITAVLGLCTLWLACGTLARDIEECQMQLVAVKPIARWQIWVGKWLGIVLLDAVLLGIAGGCVFVLMQWRANQLPEAEQAVLRNEVLVSRASLRPPLPDIRTEAGQIYQERMRQQPVAPEDEPLLRQQAEEYVRAGYQIVPPGMIRRWVIDMGLARWRLAGQPLQVRIKFHSAQPTDAEVHRGLWEIGVPDTPQVFREWMSLAPDAYFEFTVPPDLYDETGSLTIDFINYDQAALLFPLEDGIEVLYRDGSFGFNFARGLAIILCWLSLLAAIGLAAASYLSFPVATFVSFGLLLIVFSSGTIASVVEDGTVFATDHETGKAVSGPVDAVMVPLFSLMLKAITLVRGFSPVEMLSTGRSITWEQLGQAFFQIVLLMGGVAALIGIFGFARRELAAAQGSQG